MIEAIMEHIAYEIDTDPLEVRMNNIDKVKQEKLWFFISQMQKWADIDKRKTEIAEHNQVCWSNFLLARCECIKRQPSFSRFDFYTYHFLSSCLCINFEPQLL